MFKFLFIFYDFIMIKRNFCSLSSVLRNKVISWVNQNCSLNISKDCRGYFIKVLNKIHKNEQNERNLVISGENLISIR
jgi:hypothetical protein